MQKVSLKKNLRRDFKKKFELILFKKMYKVLIELDKVQNKN